jgi:uncharacterized membrane protein
VGDFILVQRVMRSAMAFMIPWNISLATLEGFLINTSYCRDDIIHLAKQAAIFARFTDYILTENASQWRNMEPFIMAGI